MAVITVSREVGSEGRYIAEKVAQILGYQFVDKNTMQRILETHGIDEFQDEYHSSPTFWSHFTARGESRAIMMDVLRRATLALAHYGNVLMLGRIERVIEKERLTEREQAEVFVRETDEVRDSFVKACYDVRLDDAGLFDLVIDTGKVPSDMAADWLIQAVGALGGQCRRDSRTSDSIEADAVLTQLLWHELGCSAVHVWRRIPAFCRGTGTLNVESSVLFEDDFPLDVRGGRRNWRVNQRERSEHTWFIRGHCQLSMPILRVSGKG